MEHKMSFLQYPATEDQKKWSAIVGELANTFAQRASVDEWEGQFHAENYADLRRSGYLTLTVPRELGGQGASLLDAVLAQYRLGQGDGATALVAGMHLVHIARLAEGRTEFSALFTQICREVVEHGALINNAVSEPATGSPSRGGLPTTTAQRQPDGSWIINGRKTFTTGSYVLHYILVGCRVEDENGDPLGQNPRGNFLVTHDMPGVHIEDTWHVMGMRGTASNDLVLDQVHVGAEAYVEQSIPLPSLPDIQNRIGGWTLPITAVYLGIAQAARDEAIRFARQRQPNSLRQPIATLPHIQEKAGKMDLALLESRAILFGVAEQLSTNPGSVPTSIVGATKHVVTNHAVEVVDIAMRLVGGASLSLSSPLQRYYRDVRAGLHNPPMDDATITLLGKQALGTKES
jgi:alkylation response protein AidB-like acyl-CoA dehydrogenase